MSSFSSSLDLADVLTALRAQDREAAYNLLVLLQKHPQTHVVNAATFPEVIEHVVPTGPRLTALALNVVKAVGDLQPALSEGWAGAPTLVSVLIALIEGTDLALADKAGEAMESLVVGASSSAKAVLGVFWRASDAHLKSSGDMTLFLRYACTFARIMGRGGRLFASCDALGAPNRLVEVCQRCNDVLAQIVFMELLTELGKSAAPLSFLVASGTVDWLAATAAGGDGLQATPALHALAEILTVAGTRGLLLASDNCDDLVTRLVGTRSFVPTLATFLDSRDDADRSAGIYALTSFAVANKLALTRVAQDAALCAAFFAIINLGKAEATSAVLLSVARILEAFNGTGAGNSCNSMGAAEAKAETETASSSSVAGNVEDSEVVSMKQQLFLQLGKAKQGGTVAYLIKTARMPVPETRVASHRLLAALVQQPSGWGLREVFTNGSGFRAFLTDRDTEHNKEGKVHYPCSYHVISTSTSNPQPQPACLPRTQSLP